MICVNSVRVTPGSVTLQAGKWYYGARAEVCPLNASCRSVRWWSDNPNVASVNASSGYIYARAAGAATIWAEAIDGSGCHDRMTVLVKSAIPVESVELVPDSLSMETGSSYLLSAVVCPVNATKKSVTWCSSNTGVATVSSSGRVTAVSNGSAIITATANDGSGRCGNCQVTVTDKILVSSVIVSPANHTMVVGDFVFLRETVCPTNASDKCVIWSSSDETILSVNSVTGFVHALKVGTAKIYATARDGSNVSGCCNVTIRAPIPAYSVEVSPDRDLIHVGETVQLKATVCPETATNKSVRWSSSNPDVASVGTYSGIVTGKAGGQAEIIATTVDGNHTAKCRLTVFYCGDLLYKDIAHHSFTLQDDGYYVCSTCGYRIKSPFLQDKEVLNKSDFLSIAALYHEYLLVIEQYPFYAPKLLAMIDSIRSLPENKNKYEYCDGNGVYVPVHNSDFDGVRMYINVNKGNCLRDWVLLNVMISIVGAVIPKPYNLIVSTIAPLLTQTHPGVTEFSAFDIVKEFALYLLGENKITKEVAKAITTIFTVEGIANGTSCTNECYNVNIVMISKEAPYELYQVNYHFSDGIETMSRNSEYLLNGMNYFAPKVDYHDNVNHRDYSIR